MNFSKQTSTDITHLIAGTRSDPWSNTAATIAMAETSDVRIAVAKMPGEDDEAAMLAGRAFPALLMQAFDLEHFDRMEGPDDGGPQTAWDRLAKKVAVAQAGSGDRYEVVTVLLDARGEEGDAIILKGGATCEGKPITVKALPRKPQTASLVARVKDTIAATRGDVPPSETRHPLASNGMSPMPYDGTEFAIVMRLGKDDIRPILTRGEWLDAEHNHGELAWSLNESFSNEEPGLYLMTGEGWRTAHIPYEQDADSGFDASVRPYAPGDAAIFGHSHEDVLAEAEGQLEQDEAKPDFLT